MNKNLKTFWVVAGMAVVIVGAGTLVNNSPDLQAVISRVRTKVIDTTPAPAPAASTDSVAYNQLVQQYRTARIQFGATCQATPSMASYRNGASIMLDNHTNQAHVVSVGGTSYTLPAYSYQVITLSSSAVPGSLSVNCDRSVNVATIRISQ